MSDETEHPDGMAQYDGPKLKKEAPRDYIVTELMWAYRHLFAVSTVAMDSLKRCRGVSGNIAPDYANSAAEIKRVSGLEIAASLAIQRALEFLCNEDLDKIDQRIRGERADESLTPGFATRADMVERGEDLCDSSH